MVEAKRKSSRTFNGQSLMITNCIVRYQQTATRTNIYNRCSRIPRMQSTSIASMVEDFSRSSSLKKCPAPTEIETGEIVGGFAHRQVFALADTVVEAVKSGAIKKFMWLAATAECQVKTTHRFAKALPKDTIILTAGCLACKCNSAIGEFTCTRRRTVQHFILTSIDHAQAQGVFGLDALTSCQSLTTSWYERL